MKNERGQMVLGVAVVLAILCALFYISASEKTSRVVRIYRSTEANRYAHEIAADLAVKLRWSYDIARAMAETTTNPLLCSNAGGSIVTVGTVELCWPVNGDICTFHPARPSLAICLKLNADVFAKNTRVKPESNFVALLLRPSLAQASSFYSPALPNPTDTNNSLTQLPICLNGSCEVTCGVNADCLTFKFCPLSSASCSPTGEDLIWQTVGFFK